MAKTVTSTRSTVVGVLSMFREARRCSRDFVRALHGSRSGLSRSLWGTGVIRASGIARRADMSIIRPSASSHHAFYQIEEV
jgi:hypothetical protein